MIRRVAANTVMESLARRAVAGGETVPAAFAAAVVDDIDAVAYRKGYGEGFEAGEQDGLRDMEQRKLELEAQAKDAMDAELRIVTEKERRLDALILGVEGALQRYEQGMQELAFELALHSLSHLFMASESDRAVLARLCESMAHQHRGKALHMAVSPEDRTLLPERMGGIEIVEAVDLLPGSCRIVGERGDMESAVEVRLAAIYDSMLGALGVRR